MPVTDIGTAWVRVQAPTEPPITLDDAKAHARIVVDVEDALLESYIGAATEAAEGHLGRGLCPQVWKLSLDGWANRIPLPMAAPLIVGVLGGTTYPIVQYYDANGSLQTLSASGYTIDTLARPARIVRKAGASWPTLQADRLDGRVVITYAVGFASAADVPELIKQGIRLYVTYLDCDRDGGERQALEARLAAERCWSDRVEWTPPEC